MQAGTEKQPFEVSLENAINKRTGGQLREFYDWLSQQEHFHVHEHGQYKVRPFEGRRYTVEGWLLKDHLVYELADLPDIVETTNLLTGDGNRRTMFEMFNLYKGITVTSKPATDVDPYVQYKLFSALCDKWEKNLDLDNAIYRDLADGTRLCLAVIDGECHIAIYGDDGYEKCNAKL